MEWLLIVICVIIGLGLTWLQSVMTRSARLKRTLKNSQHRSIETFSDHEAAKVAGVLSYTREPLRAPLTGRLCAFYEVHIERPDNRNGSGFSTVLRDTQGQVFLLDDGTGRAVVDPSGAQTAVTVDSQTKSGAFDAPTERERAYLQANGIENKDWAGEKKLRYSESILEAGEMVAVLGHGTWEPDPDAGDENSGYRGERPLRLRMQSSSRVPLQISDDARTLR